MTFSRHVLPHDRRQSLIARLRWWREACPDRDVPVPACDLAQLLEITHDEHLVCGESQTAAGDRGNEGDGSPGRRRRSSV
jgi:hypothetical protein